MWPLVEDASLTIDDRCFCVLLFDDKAFFSLHLSVLPVDVLEVDSTYPWDDEIPIFFGFFKYSPLLLGETMWDASTPDAHTRRSPASERLDMFDFDLHSIEQQNSRVLYQIFAEGQANITHSIIQKLHKHENSAILTKIVMKYITSIIEASRKIEHQIEIFDWQSKVHG